MIVPTDTATKRRLAVGKRSHDGYQPATRSTSGLHATLGSAFLFSLQHSLNQLLGQHGSLCRYHTSPELGTVHLFTLHPALIFSERRLQSVNGSTARHVVLLSFCVNMVLKPRHKSNTRARNSYFSAVSKPHLRPRTYVCSEFLAAP